MPNTVVAAARPVGFAVHQSLSQPLARVELQVVYRTLYRRIPSLRLAADLGQIPLKARRGCLRRLRTARHLVTTVNPLRIS